MLKIVLHPEVIKFLQETATVRIYEDQETFIVNNSWYVPTNEENTYTVKFLKPQEPNE